LDQLILYSETNTIDEEAVRKLSESFLSYEPFDLTNALLRKDTVEELKIFRFFYDLTEDMPKTVGMLHWQLRQLWQIRKILEKNGGREECSRAFKMSPARLSIFIKQAQKFDVKTIERLIEMLWEFDWNSKTGGCNAVIAMETFLARACAGNTSAGQLR
jgi:DNA polymerase III delta subunit